MTQASYRQIGGPDGLLARRQAFKGHTMRAETSPGYVNLGRLPHDERQRFPMGNGPKGVAYIVYSYSTPIAWVTNDGEIVVPDVKYSVTTSRQQTLCRAWL